MDIYTKTLRSAHITADFDDNDLAFCAISPAGSDETTSHLLSVQRDTKAMTLRVTVSGIYRLPDTVDLQFLTELGEVALGPLRSQLGVGICPASTNLTFFAVVPVAEAHTLATTVNDLLTAARLWDGKILARH